MLFLTSLRCQTPTLTEWHTAQQPNKRKCELNLYDYSTMRVFWQENCNKKRMPFEILFVSVIRDDSYIPLRPNRIRRLRNRNRHVLRFPS